MFQKKQNIERDVIALLKSQKTSSEVKSSLDALQSILTPRLNAGVGFVGGGLAVSPGHCIQFGPGVVGPTAEYAGYNQNGEFFASPTSAQVFSGVKFDNGSNIVVISKEEAKAMLKDCCKKKVAKLSQLQRTQLGGTITKVSSVKAFMKKLVLYGSYISKTDNKKMLSVDLSEGYFEFIESVLEEYSSLTSDEKVAYYKEWDLMAHGFDDYKNPTAAEPTKWDQKSYAKFKDLSSEVKKSFDDDVYSALLCRAVKDAIFCFDNDCAMVNTGHTHYFNVVLDKVDALIK